jgi:serpin B
LYVANGLWISGQFPVKQTYITNALENYSAEIRNGDFINKNESEREEINRWVAEKTGNKILNALKNVDPLTRILIVNTIYFKAIWQDVFGKNNTEMKDFNLQNGLKEKVSMMYQTAEKMCYFENKQLQMVRIPYHNTITEMIIILPKNRINIENEISNENVNRWMDNASPQKVKLHLPKFGFKKEYCLNKILMENGMLSAFGNNANFSKINESRGLYIKDVLHETYIDVDEKGTEAVALTSVKISYELQKLKRDQVEMEMNVDHPFYFIICERMSGGYIFIGKVNNPNLR